MPLLPLRLDLRAFAALALAWAAAAAAQTEAPRHSVPDTMAQRVLACTGCHGKEGVATRDGFFPRIAGKPAGYLHQQLLAFRDGRRSNKVMAAMLANLTDAYLLEIAHHFATLELPYPPTPAVPAPAAVVARGRQLLTQGDASQQLPACTQCHGDALTGVLPATPGLLGLPRDYLLAQFGAWRTGQRRAAAPDCMATIARRLSPADLAAVATALAQQAMPPDTRPAARPPQPLPPDCGAMR